LPSLIRKFHDAKIKNAESVNVWGSGKTRREFLYSDDLAEGVLFLMENYVDSKIVNIGTGEDLTIKELATIIQQVVGFKGVLKFDKTKPDGTPQKILDVSKINSLGWKATTTLKKGIEKVYSWYIKNYLIKK